MQMCPRPFLYTDMPSYQCAPALFMNKYIHTYSFIDTYFRMNTYIPPHTAKNTELFRNTAKNTDFQPDRQEQTKIDFKTAKCSILCLAGIKNNQRTPKYQYPQTARRRGAQGEAQRARRRGQGNLEGKIAAAGRQHEIFSWHRFCTKDIFF